LLRERSRAEFSDDEQAFVAAAAGTIALGLRRTAIPSAVGDGGPSEPIVVLLDAADRLVSATSSGAAALAEVTGRDVDRDPMPIEVQQLLSRARAIGVGRLAAGSARTRLRTSKGRWLTLDAAPLTRRSDASTVVTIRPLGPDEVAPLIAAAHELSSRELDVVTRVASGLGTSEIAAELFISSHTVRDHLKAIFEKVGVRSRGELVARLFATHAFADLHDGMVHVGDDG
jgi:DNA-binding CsgD family transcriptional regulator